MSANSQHNLLVEVPYLQPPPSSRSLLVAGTSSDTPTRTAAAAPFPSPAVGGGLYYSAGPASSEQHGFSWGIMENAPSVLQLVEFSLARDLKSNCIQLRFPAPLFPNIFLRSHPNHLEVLVLSGSDTVWRLSIPLTRTSQAASILAGFVLGPNTLHSVRIGQDVLERLGQVTCLDSFAGGICLGTSQGSVLCVPSHSFEAGTLEGSVELRDGGTSMQRLITGFFTKAQVPAVVDVAVVSSTGQPLLCALHEDCTLRLWDVNRQQRLVAEPPVDKASCRPLSVRAVQLPGSAGTGQLIAQFGSQDAAGNPAAHFIAYQFQGEGEAFSRGALSVVASWHLEGTSVLDYAVQAGTEAGPTAGQPVLWVLSTDGRLRGWADTGRIVAEAHPLERQAEEMFSGSEDDVALQEELWQTMKCILREERGQEVPAEALSNHFLSLLMAPGTDSRPAVRAAMSALGHQMSSEEANSLSTSGLADRIKMTVEALEARVGELAAWQRMMAAYWQSWRQLHPLAGLLAPPGGGGALAVLRAGPSVSVLRAGSPLEAIRAGLAVPQGGSAVEVAAVQACVGAVAGLLGSLASEVVAALLEAGLDAGSSVLPCLVRTLAVGPGARGERPVDGQSRHSRWRRQRTRLALEVGARLQALYDPAAALQAYANLLAAPHAPDAMATTAQASGAGNGGIGVERGVSIALTSAARQLASAHFAAAAGAALLAAYLGHARVLGTWSLPGPQLLQLLAMLSSQTVGHMRAAAIARWLTTTPGTPTADQSAEPSRLLHDLRLGSPNRSASPLLASGASAAVGQPLLRDFLAQRGGCVLDGDLGQSAASLYAYMLAGGDATHPGDVDSAVMQQVLQTGRRLFEAGEVAQLLPLLALAGHAAQEPGPLFLKGYSIASQLRRPGSDAERRTIMERAAGPLFRAAAALRSGGGGSGSPGSYSLLKGLLEQLWRDTTGTFVAESPQAEELQYYEALMMLFERLGCPEGAARFAAAAVRQVDVAFPEGEGGGDGGGIGQRRAREGRLWANLFVYALEAGNYQEAYAALQSNPVPERQVDCLQRLTHMLAGQGQLATLVGLPFAGNVVLQDGSRRVVVSLLQEAARLLRRRAEHAELAASPQPHQVLYDFCAARGDWHGAAGAMAALAARLPLEAPHPHPPDIFERIQAALGAAVNALSLVEPRLQWLEDPLKAPPAPAPATELTEEGFLQLRRQMRGSILTLEVLQKRYALARARAAIARRTPATARLTSSEDETLGQLLAQGLFEEAVALACALKSGQALAQALAQALERTAGVWAAACVRAQLREAAGADAQASAAFDAEPCSGGGGGGGAGAEPAAAPAAALWDELRACLEQYDGPATAWRLRVAAADSALGVERRLRLPTWLQELFQVGRREAGMAGEGADPVALLRIYLKYDRLQDAAEVALAHFAAWDEEAVDLERQRAGVTYFPYGLLYALDDRLATAAAAAALPPDPAAELQAMRRQLQAVIERHLAVAGAASERLEELHGS